MGFCFVFYKPIIGPWELREKNALQLANQSARYMGYKNKPYNN